MLNGPAGLAFALLVACSGAQSALDPAGRGAEQISALFWWMAGGALVIWLAVVALTLYALHSPQPHSERKATLLIVGGGFVVPTAILTVLLVFALAVLPDLMASTSGALRVRVSGEQWWWRVQYLLPDGRAVELANEVRLPVGASVELLLESPDVIHSFWIPSLGGKVDMIPGRVTRLALRPTRTGVYRGVCAEYCGTSHALMAFDVVVMEQREFLSWISHQRGPAEALSASHGGGLFLANGCGACHTVRGTPASGVIGPDLTHVGSRHSIGAGMLPNETHAFSRWIARSDAVKPGVRMPHFEMLPAKDVRAIAEYMEALQ